MYIKELNIKAFGPLTDRVVRFDRGLNVIEGENESGKSTLAMFIKFVFYGLSGKAADGDISEKEHYVNWDFDIAAGYLVAECRRGTFRIERRLHRVNEGGRTLYRESCRITDTSDGSVVKTPKSPGEYFFGFPEGVFVQSAFVKDLSSAKIDGAGLKVALENLMSSGDEQINTKRAVEKLDSARKALRHRNGGGGRIPALEEERDRLKALLEDSKGTAKRVVDLEGTLSDIEAKRAKREAEAKELSALCGAYEAVRIGSKVKTLEETEAEVSSIKRELETLPAGVDGKLVAKIELCEKTVRDSETDIETLAEKREELEKKLGNRDTGEVEDADEVTAKAKSLRRGSTFCLALGCTLAVFTFFTLAFILIPPLRSRLSEEGYLGFLIGGAAALALITAASIFLFRRFSRSYDELLDKWDAEDERSLGDALKAKNERVKYARKLEEQIKKIDAVTEEAITKHDREIDLGMSYGDVLGIEPSENVFDVLSRAREAAKEIIDAKAELTSRLAAAEGRLSAIVADVGDEERGEAAEAERTALEAVDRDRILAMTKDDYNKLKRAKDFAESTASSLRERQSSLERELAALGAAGKTPSEIASRLSVIESELGELNKKYEALVVAETALIRAGEKMRSDVMPRVAAEAASIMNSVTDGKYSDLSTGEDLSLSASAGGVMRGVDFLSEGTKDASYVSVRAALVKVMYADETPPMIFDESFARLDRARLNKMFGVLAKEGMPQSLVFTSRTEDAAEAAGANVISL